MWQGDSFFFVLGGRIGASHCKPHLARCGFLSIKRIKPVYEIIEAYRVLKLRLGQLNSTKKPPIRRKSGSAPREGPGAQFTVEMLQDESGYVYICDKCILGIWKAY